MSEITQTFTTIPGIFRNVYENCDIMVNNDERAVYSANLYTFEEFFDKNKKRLVFSRPIYLEEKLESIDSDDNLSDLTRLLDSAYKLLFAAQKFEWLLNLSNKKFSLEQFLSNYIGYNYYDCLTGGMDTNIYWFCIELCQKINPEIEVYCEYKIKDFIATAKAGNANKPELSHVLKLIGF
jgi:hypothetical protein